MRSNYSTDEEACERAWHERHLAERIVGHCISDDIPGEAPNYPADSEADDFARPILCPALY